MYEKSLVIIKPDGIQRRLAGQVLARFEQVGFKIHAMKFTQANSGLLEKHYQEHVGKDFYPLLESYMSAGPVLVLVLGGVSAIPKIRAMVGATTPGEAAPGTIRGDFAHQVMEKDDRNKALYNIIHASATPEEAEHEIGVWFTSDEVLDYPVTDDMYHGV